LPLLIALLMAKEILVTFKHYYRFPSINVKKGQWVRLYSGVGDYKTGLNDNKQVYHSFFWGSDDCIWNNKTTDQVFLYEVNLHDSFKIKPQLPPKK
jgi:hypothetical protein